jgi:hypothetical protein
LQVRWCFNSVANWPSLSVTFTTSLLVTLSYFKATPKNNSVLLSWVTSQETSNHFFVILHSRDGTTFFPIGKVNGNGTSSTKLEYSFIHNINITGNHFYRLAQVDFDGKRKYSSIEKVFITINNGDVQVFPNPVLSEFKISSSGNLKNLRYKIINQTGAILLSGNVGSGNIKADALLPDTYYLCISNSNEKLVNTIMFYKM